MILPVELPEKSRVLVAGCGGGFDVVCGLPVGLALQKAGHEVHFASYSFTPLRTLTKVQRPLPQLCRIDAESTGSEGYFPEKHLARWWDARFGGSSAVWCFDGLGVAPTRESYAYLKDHLKLDAVFVVDGGVDGLFLGNEHDTGTPSMDAVSILAADAVQATHSYFVCSAFGTEGRGYEMRHADVLMRMAELVRLGAMNGVAALLPQTEIGHDFLDALGKIHGQMDATRHSIIAASIASAMRGDFGETAVTVKCRDAPVWVSPLTLLYWFFDLKAVAAKKPYRDQVMDSKEVYEVGQAIEVKRHEMGILPAGDIPI